MYDVLRQIGPVVLLVVWFGCQIVLYFRYRAKERPYLRHFPSGDGVPLDMMLPGRFLSRGKTAIREALWLRQADPELERMRRAVQRRGIYMMMWLVGGFIVIALVLPSWVFTASAR